MTLADINQLNFEVDSTDNIPTASWEDLVNMAGANYGDIDFEEINEATGLAADEIKCLKVFK